MTSGCVTVTGPPRRICSRNSGTTEPDEASTLPKRTMQKRVVRGAFLQCLQHELRQPLGRAHDVRGVHRLVGGDQHEGLDATLERRLRRVPGADDVVVDAFDDVVLDDRHVLVGGGVIDRLHAAGADDFAHAMAVMRVAEQRQDLDRQPFASAAARPARAGCCRARARTSRTAPAGAGRSAGSGGTAPSRSSRPRRVTITHLLRMQDSNSFGLGGTGVATQQVADVDVVQLVDAGLAGDDVREVRQRLDVNAQRLERARISRRRRREADGMASNT